MTKYWLLPEFITDVLPSEARQLEELRRAMLDCFHCHGYELVIPPLLEYIDSLLTGSGSDLNLRTFKLVDQLSGRTMGVRADITPQVARIDAHVLNRQGLARLCYAGSILHTRPAGFYVTREPLQVGAEIYGYAGIEADIEIQSLLIAVLRLAKLDTIHLDLCHAGILSALLGEADLSADAIKDVYAALAAKDVQALKEVLDTSGQSLDLVSRHAILALPSLHGQPDEVLLSARKVLPKQEKIEDALTQLAHLASCAAQENVRVTLDLADLRGYQYHTGLMFSAYTPGAPNAIARGGRYDKIGQAFGRARPATGFSLDLREVAALVVRTKEERAILAPWNQSAALLEKIANLRAAGEVVVQAFPGQSMENEYPLCDRLLEFAEGKWAVVSRE